MWKEETTLELNSILSLLPVLMRSKNVTCSFGVLQEIFKDKICVVTKVEILKFCVNRLIQTRCTCHQFRILPNTSLLTSPTPSKQKSIVVLAACNQAWRIKTLPHWYHVSLLSSFPEAQKNVDCCKTKIM